MANPSLRLIVLTAAGQDVRKCQHCALCRDTLKANGDLDLSLDMVLQLVILNDEEVLTSRTLWSDHALKAASHACTSGLDIEAVILALRTEAQRRGMVEANK
jgi:heterodisulfide reductase subunit C